MPNAVHLILHPVRSGYNSKGFTGSGLDYELSSGARGSKPPSLLHSGPRRGEAAPSPQAADEGGGVPGPVKAQLVRGERPLRHLCAHTCAAVQAPVRRGQTRRRCRRTDARRAHPNVRIRRLPLASADAVETRGGSLCGKERCRHSSFAVRDNLCLAVYPCQPRRPEAAAAARQPRNAP